MRVVRSIAKRLTAAALLVCVLAAMYSLSAYASSERVVKQDSKGRWACMKDGKVEKSYTGIAHNKYGWWRIRDGYVDFDATGVCSNEYGWFYVKDGKVDWEHEGIEHNKYGWWRIRDGRVDWSANGVFRNKHGWWYVKQGGVDFDYTGLAANGLGNWYIKKGAVDFKKNGTYEKGGIEYKIVDGKVQNNGKVIYLTFDDGPAAYTDQLLGILDKYGVKATFFVTSAYPSYQYLIKKEYNAGHGIAAHTYTHNYATIYKSTAGFWSDHERIQEIIEQQTGHRTTMMRFPGGTSNTVSRRYCRGVMSDLSRQAGERYLTFYDWNVDADDAGKTRTSDGVFNNITSGVKYHDQSLVLCHDVKPYTVNAMDRIIKWCLQNGYTFRVCQPGGYTYHLKVAN